MGLEAEDLVGGVEGLSEADMVQFNYPNDREISRAGVRGLYLNNYIRWDSKAQHEAMVTSYEYEPATQQRTFDTCNDVDCQHYSGLHDWIKFSKWGYGKASDHASREIRLRRMTRDQGIDLVARYRDVAPADESRLLKWLNLSNAEFEQTIDRFRDPRIWEHNGSSWTLRDCVTQHQDDPETATAALSQTESWRDFPPQDNRVIDPNPDAYVLMARGHIDIKPVPEMIQPHKT
jgi:hypothetical protein